MGKSFSPLEMSWMAHQMEIDKPTNYLPMAYENSKNSLYSHTVFQILSSLIKDQFGEAKILDLGCADRRASRLLSIYGLKISAYCGVDHNINFRPNIEADVRDLDAYYDKIGFRPNVVLITDVLEHLENGAEDIQKFLKILSSKIEGGAKVYISAPQMYRLDRLKLSHLFYPEHKVRLTLSEWEKLIGQDFRVEERVGVGYVSVIPYLIMFFPFYRENGWTGSLFKKTRGLLSKSTFLRRVDHFLSVRLKNYPLFCQLSNSALFICVKREDHLA